MFLFYRSLVLQRGSRRHERRRGNKSGAAPTTGRKFDFSLAVLIKPLFINGCILDMIQSSPVLGGEGRGG